MRRLLALRSPLRALAAAAAFTVVAGVGAHAPAQQPSDPAYESALVRALLVESQVVQTLRKARAATVSVLCKTIPAAPAGVTTQPEPVLASCGSGVIVGIEGRPWVVTNVHVAAEADVLEVVTLDGAVHAVELADSVERYDIALLRFTGQSPAPKGVPVLPRASRELSQGQWVLATGNPFFLATDGRSAASLGVVSGLDRVLGGQHLYGNAVQHDAPVNPGNSGGPLWNLRGDLVGINGMIATRGGSGIGPSNSGAAFSIPIHQIEPYLKLLKDAKADARAGDLGVATETAKDGSGSPDGALVTRIESGSPVLAPEKQAMAVGDVITAIVAKGAVVRVRTSTDLVNALCAWPAGTPVKVRYRRKERESSWSGRLGAQK